MLGSMLNTIHNLRHYQRVMAGLRDAIQQGTLAAFVDAFMPSAVCQRRRLRDVPAKQSFLQQECYMSFLIPAAYAQEAAAGPAGTGFEWVFLVGFLVIFYLMIWRPRPSGPRNTRT